jgi:hypothetical protein
MQCAQSDDRPRHAGLRPDPLTRKPRRGEYNHRSIRAPNAMLLLGVSRCIPMSACDQRTDLLPRQGFGQISRH